MENPFIGIELDIAEQNVCLGRCMFECSVGIFK